MALKTFKPNTPSNRYKEWNSFEEITKDTPQKSLTVALRKSGGRNNTGRITCRHIGGGHDRRYRLIDFKRSRRDESAKVIAIEYDPNRSARIALLEYRDGERSYILAPGSLQVGASVMAGEKAGPEVGNALPPARLPSFPTGKGTSPSSACLPVRSARSTPTATPRSARSATPSI